MNLERIEITGFKSFADKTVIEFDKGVTAIVGPNGSGKSNLSEAIKWVLGEQSAKSLRGKKMDDIIFAGSQTRKPTNVAEVTLVLNNEDRFLPLDVEEIYITRRFHRNGESENFINKKPCRLKDIVNLLMDSGLGKDSFSIISQGKVETIFNNKPEERRAMFEEVAGVLKYKTRKQEASRKLEKTQEHLDRVEDILHEIEGQLKPLALQKEKALIYQEKKAQLSQIDIALIVAEIESVNEQFRLGKQELQVIEQQLVQKQSEQDVVEQNVGALRQKLEDVEQDLLKKQNQFVQIVQKYEQIIGEHRLLAERLDFSKQNRQQQDSARYEKEKHLEQLKALIKNLQEEQSEKQEQLQEWQKLLAESQQEELFLSEENQERIEEERQNYIDQLQEQTRLNNELASLEKERSHLETQTKQGKEGSESLEQELTRTNQLWQAKQIELDSVQQQVSDLLQAHRQHEDKLQVVKQNRQSLEVQVMNYQADLSRTEARYSSLQDLTDDYAGFYQGVKEVLKRRQQWAGVHGAIAELIKVPEQYTTAIDIALGASMQHIVVSDEQSARTVIDYLKKQRLGRATFLPLTVIKPRLLPSDISNILQQEKGYIGVASELIQTDTMYQSIVSSLLGQTLVADNMVTGNQIAKKIQYRYRIVTLDGDIIHTGGSMTGGATTQQKANSLLARQNELENLKHASLQLKDKLNATREQLKSIQLQEDECQEQLKQVQTEGTQARLQERELSAGVQQLQDKVLQLEAQQKLFVVEQSSAQASLKEIAHHYARAKERLQVVNHALEKTKQHIETLNSSQEDKARQLTVIRSQMQERSTQVAILNEQLVTIQQRLKGYRLEEKTEKDSLSAITISLHEQTQSREELVEQLNTLASEKEKAFVEKEQLEQDLTTIREVKKDLDAELFLEETRSKDIQQVVQKLLKDSGTLEARNSRFEVTLDTHLTRLNEEYQLTFEAAKTVANLEMSIQDASRYVSQLKREIEDLGLINLAAIEEYDAVHDRFVSMSEQQTDLLQAKDGLLSTMSEMDEEMTRRFKETFFAIKQQFEKTFPKLFGGGRASLELTDPDNLLETGIEIIAQPPGKRLQNLSLLSGGEKAFTAIALLFAILEVKPVPFCLLDEVEAALDEANVGRYGRYLKEFIEQTQFIVITHRKGTMEEADILYGVTMQESGVSKLASVRFEDYV